MRRRGIKRRRPTLVKTIKRDKRPNYSWYINSKAWKAKRKWFIDKQVQECFCCNKPYQSGFHVHHVTYKNLGAEKLADLRLVCVSCHDEIHVYEKSHDVSLLEATNYVKSLKNRANRLKKGSRPTTQV